MSEGALRRNLRKVVWPGLFVIGAVLLLLVCAYPLHLLKAECTVQQDQRRIEQALQGLDAITKYPEKRSIGDIADRTNQVLFPPIPDGRDGEDQSKAASNGAGEEHESWWDVFLCSVNAADYALAVFTALLFISTSALWLVTERTLWHTRDSSRRELRAYISASPFHLENLGPGLVPTVKIKISNNGKTPARNVAQFSGVMVLRHPLPEGRPNFNLSRKDPPSRPVVHPGMPIGGTARGLKQITPAQFRAITMSDDWRIYCFGIVEYEDIFGLECSTKYCASIPQKEMLRVVMGFIGGTPENTISWEFSERHNEIK